LGGTDVRDVESEDVVASPTFTPLLILVQEKLKATLREMFENGDKSQPPKRRDYTLCWAVLVTGALRASEP